MWLKLDLKYEGNAITQNKEVNLSLANHVMPCLSKQCRSRLVGF